VLTVSAPKTRAGVRWVPLAPAAAELLAAHLRDHTGSQPDSPVFSTTTGQRLRPNNLRRREWSDATASAGLSGLRMHDMRHTAVALWVHTGASVLQISKLAGHTQVAFTMQRYGHLYDDATDALTDALEALMTASLPMAAGQGASNVVQIRGKRSEG
jgi:integrase